MFSLQKALFTQNEERLLAVVHVKSVKKQTKASFAHKSLLCLTVQRECVFLHKVKVDKDDLYALRQSWNIDELVSVDGISPLPSNRSFALQLNKSIKWNADDPSEKDAFLYSLWKLSKKFVMSYFKLCFTLTYTFPSVHSTLSLSFLCYRHHYQNEPQR